MNSKLKKGIITVGVIGAIALGGASLDADKNDVSQGKLTEKYNASVEIKAKYKMESATLVKTDVKNAELDKYKGEPKDEIKTTIGDANSQEFTPDIELKRWNEVSFKLKPKGLTSVATKDKSLSFEGEKVKFKTPKMDFEMYDVPATTNDNGSYKYIWYLNEKPATNIVEFVIESSGLDFFYQPPLTEEYQNGYSEKFQKEIVVSETQVKDLDGNILIERPENVVGSYAVYHSTKGGMNDKNGKDYKTGKAFHIYRPHIIDANGSETWGILHIENGIYSVEIPQEFLDKAVYPIKSNDTFGWGTVGGTYWKISYSMASLFQSAGGGSVTSISTWLTLSATKSCRFGIYDNGTGSADVSVDLIANGTTDSTSLGARTAELTTLNLTSSATINESTYYRLAAYDGNDSSGGYYYDTASGSIYVQTGDLPSPSNFVQYSSVRMSIYATYTLATSGTITRAVVTANDGFCYSAGTAVCYNSAGLNIRMGYRSGTDWGDIYVAFRFQNIYIPQGSTITSATFTYEAYDTDASTDNVKVWAEAADNSAALVFTSGNSNSPQGKTAGSQSVAWTLPNQTTGTQYTSPDISTVIQEVINRGGWSGGNALTILIRNNGATENHNADGYDGTKDAYISVSYSAPSAGATTNFQEYRLNYEE